MQIDGEGLQNLLWFMGIVEDRDDPTHHGRVRVRVFGIHPPLNTNEVLTEDLPWAFMINGTGGAMISIPEEGDWVFGFFMDGRDAQHPYVLGVIHGTHFGIPFDGTIGYDEGEVDPALAEAVTNDNTSLGQPASGPGVGYPDDLTRSEVEGIIREEAQLRGIDPDTAVSIYRHEGYSSYQSQIARTGNGSYNGKEDSYGPFQLYRGGGLGNEYETLTGRNLRNDNTRDGVQNQVRFSLDRAVDQGWQPWYGRGPAGVGVREGLNGSKKIRNWD